MSARWRPWLRLGYSTMAKNRRLLKLKIAIWRESKNIVSYLLFVIKRSSLQKLIKNTNI